MGGNKKLFDLLKEYEILDLDFEERYSHKAVLLYKKKHMFLLDGGKE